MAGDMVNWIKMRKSLWTDGRVRILSRKLRTERGHVIGALVRFWSVADEHADENGYLHGYTKDDIDAEVELNGFCNALPPDWLEVLDDGLQLPDYTRHNGKTGKARAIDTQRKHHKRMSEICPKSVRNNSDKNRTRIDKNRIDKNICIKDLKKKVYKKETEQIYQLYPRKIGKAKAITAIETAIKKLNSEPPDGVISANVITWLSERVAKYAKSDAGNNGTFTPHPATWFNQARYFDDEKEWSETNDNNGRTGNNQTHSKLSAGQQAKRDRDDLCYPEPVKKIPIL